MDLNYRNRYYFESSSNNMMSGNESIGVSYYTILSRRRKYCNAINRCLQEIVVSDSPSITDRCTYLIQSIPKKRYVRFALDSTLSPMSLLVD